MRQILKYNSKMTTIFPLTWQNVVDFYDHLTLHIVPGPRSFSYFIPFILTIMGLATPPRILSHRQLQWLVLPSIYAVQMYVWIHHRSFDVISMNGALTAFMLLGWYDVRHDFHYVQRQQTVVPPTSQAMPEGHPKETTAGVKGLKQRQSKEPVTLNSQPEYNLEAYPSSFVPRLRWISILFASMRMTDWHIGLPSHDTRQPSRIIPLSTFVGKTISQGTLAYILLGFSSPYLEATGCQTNTTALTKEYFQTQVVRSLFLLAYFYAALALFTALLPHIVSIGAMLVVPSLRYNPLTSPLTWPGHFGALSSIYATSETSPPQNLGLRAFWGVFWHQNMRFVTSTPGVALASVCGLSKGSKVRYMTIVTSSFFWSGVVHMGVIPPEPLGTGLSSWEMRFRVASFFWFQIIGIVVEDMIQTIFDAPKREPIRAHAEDGGWSLRNSLQSLLLKGCILVWTTGFLAFTAWWTVLPVACEMGWLNIKLLPVWFTKDMILMRS